MIMAGYILACWVIAVQVSIGMCGFLQRPDPETKPVEEVLKDWHDLESNIRSSIDQILKQMMPYAVQISSQIDVSPECSVSMLRLLVDLRNFKEWAIQMLDATGKPGGGQLRGTSSALGSYDECLDITLPESVHSSTETSPRGMYCVLDLRPTLPPKPKLLFGLNGIEALRNYSSSMEFVEGLKKYSGLLYLGGYTLGVCVPSSCGLKDMQEVARYVSEEMKISARVQSCEVKQKFKVETDQVIVICFLGLFAFLTISATITQVYLQSRDDKNSTCLQLADSFSLVSNLERLFKTSKKTGQDTTFSCLNGMRFITMTWVILGHTYAFLDFRVMRETITIVDRLKGFFFQAILNGTVAVDTFLFITSVLIAYRLVTLTVNEKKNISFVVLILKRVWRLLPSMMLAVSLSVVLPLIGSGPSWNYIVEDIRASCLKNWWFLSLFINNYADVQEMCLPHTWYISLDMQLFLLALLFIYICKRCRKFSMVFLCAMAVTGMAITTAVLWFLELPPTFILLVYDMDNAINYTRYVFFAPYCHLAVYAIGLGLGTILAKKTKIIIPVRLRIVGWSLAVIGNMSVLYISVIWNSGDQHPVGLYPTIYGGLHRPLWTLGLAWTTLMCAKGYGGILTKFLSWKGFTPLNRLTYLMYLTHFLVIVYYQASLTGDVDCTHTSLVWLFFGNLAVSFGVSLVLMLLYEAPLMNLENLLSRRLNRKENTAAQTEKNVTNGKSLEKGHSHNPQDVKICSESFTRL